MTPKRKHTPAAIKVTLTNGSVEAPKPDIRTRPPKTDQELLEEYFGPDCCSSCSNPMIQTWGYCWCRDKIKHRKAQIAAELGPDKIRDERIRRLEERVKNVEVPKLNWNWASLLTGIVGYIFAVSVGIYMVHWLL